MILITPEIKNFPLRQESEKLERQLRSFTNDIENLQERVHAGDHITETEVRKLFTDIRGWLKLAYELEKSFAEYQKQTLGIAGDYGLDLDAARSAVGCRLDRLRRCCREGQVSE